MTETDFDNLPRQENGRLTYITSNGLMGVLADTCDRIMQLSATAKLMRGQVLGAERPIMLAVLNDLIWTHNKLTQVLGFKDENTPEVETVNLGKVDTRFHQYLTEMMVFCKGAACDPFLYDERAILRESAIVNLHKIRHIVGALIETMQ